MPILTHDIMTVKGQFMHKIDTKNATSEGLFTDGDPHKPEEEVATYLDASWLNAVQEEICSVITANKIELKKGDNTQLGAAISKAIDHKLDLYQPIQDNATEIKKIKDMIGSKKASGNKDNKENFLATILERLDTLEKQVKSSDERISNLETERESQALRTGKLETTTSKHSKNLSSLNELKGKLEANLSVKHIQHTFTNNGERLRILSDTSQCSGIILLHVQGKNGGEDYFEYDFMCRKGKASYYGSENLVYLQLKEHSQVTANHKTYGAKCRLIDNEIYLEQEGAEPDFPHKVNCRIIGFYNE